MTDPEILFLVVRLLEAKPASAEQLWLKAAGEGTEKSLKTIRRALLEIEHFGIPLSKKRKSYAIEKGEEYRISFAGFFKVVTEAKSSWRQVIYGDLDRKAVARILAAQARPAAFLWKLISAAVESRQIEFLYAPQHADTKRRVKWVSQWFDLKVPRGKIPVTFVPHYLVFSGMHFLLLGESLIQGDYYLRQYAVSGMEEIRLGEPAIKQLTINPRELYRHSLNVWIGGGIHEVQIENVNLTHQAPLKTRVNGEDEILSYVMASLGQIRIVDPPESIVQRAHELNIPPEFVFRMSQPSD